MIKGSHNVIDLRVKQNKFSKCTATVKSVLFEQSSSCFENKSLFRTRARHWPVKAREVKTCAFTCREVSQRQ